MFKAFICWGNFLLFISFSTLAQNENFSVWYFGNGAGLDFNSGKPVALENGESYSDESCASVSDNEGNILFYTNGIKIWDRNHNVINHYIPLSGHKSSTQGALIVSNPASYNQFFIFTVDEKGGINGLRYSIIEVSDALMNNKQLSKSGAFYTPDLLIQDYKPKLVKVDAKIMSNVTEKLTATMHKNGKSIWVITHLWNSNKFCALLLNEKGIIEDKVFSAVGSVHNNKEKSNNSESIGQLKISPDGTTLASVICYRKNAPVELFKFNNATGEITSFKSFESTGLAYGVEFSPDNKQVYASYLEGTNTVVQYNIETEKKTVIFSNQNEEIFYGALQLGPDNKIYVAKTSTYIDVINNPNSPGKNCNYRLSGVNLKNKFSVYGLPSKPVTLIPNAKNEDEQSQETESPSKTLNTTDTNDNTDKNKKNVNESCASDLSDITINCVKEVQLDAGGTNVDYKWSTGETSKVINVNKADYYSVTLTGTNCKKTMKVFVNLKSKPTKVNYLPEFDPHAGFNNYFAFSINDVKDFELIVTKRGGKVVFKTNDPKVKWDGKDLKGSWAPQGTYNWEANYTPLCTQKPEQKKGTVNLVDK